MGFSPSSAPRERVPSAARRVRVLLPVVASPRLAEKGWDDQIMVMTALAGWPAPISSCGGVVVYSASPSERRRRWKFGKL